MKDNKNIIQKIWDAITKASPYGSVEIYIQDGKITQITTRNIEKIKDDSK